MYLVMNKYQLGGQPEMTDDTSRIEWDKAGWLLVDSEFTSLVEEVRTAFFQQQGSGVLCELVEHQVPRHPCLRQLRDYALEFGAAVGYQGLTLHKVWVQRTEFDWAQTHSRQVPFEPHIDRQRYFKMMFYARDVTLPDGPMSIVRRNPMQMETLRKSLPDDYKDQRLNVVAVDKSEMTPITAPAGSVLLFDTNVPHVATMPTVQGAREVVRFDFWCPEWKIPPHSGRPRHIFRRLAGHARETGR